MTDVIITNLSSIISASTSSEVGEFNELPALVVIFLAADLRWCARAWLMLTAGLEQIPDICLLQLSGPSGLNQRSK